MPPCPTPPSPIRRYASSKPRDMRLPHFDICDFGPHNGIWPIADDRVACLLNRAYIGRNVMRFILAVAATALAASAIASTAAYAQTTNNPGPYAQAASPSG